MGISMTAKATATADLSRTGLAPRGLSREQSSAYIGVSAAKFDAMVKDGRMPPPKCVDGRRVWDRHRLDMAFDALPDAAGTVSNDSDDVWGRIS